MVYRSLLTLAEAYQHGDLLGRVRALGGLDQAQLAAKVARLVARTSQRPEGDCRHAMCDRDVDCCRWREKIPVLV